jgi:hypothetical protein
LAIGYLAIGYSNEPEASLLAFSGFGCVFLSLQIVATATALFDFVELFSP